MNIQQATRQYEGWLADHVRVVKSDLGTKHELQRQFTKDLDSEALGRGTPCRDFTLVPASSAAVAVTPKGSSSAADAPC
jgi:hypothetical protein